MDMSDRMKLSMNPQFQAMLNKFGYGREKVQFSAEVMKINRFGRSQKRVLGVTDEAIYNMKPNEMNKYKRRIAVKNVGAITMSNVSTEFTIHVPDEYDYRYKSARKEDIYAAISAAVKALTGKRLKLFRIDDDKLGNVTVTKEMAVHLSREEVIRRKKMLAAEEHDSDYEEEKKPDERVVQLFGEQPEKVTIDSFDLLCVLGRGAFGKVMQVRKKDTGKVYAMKILKKTMIFARKQVEHTRAERKVLEDFQHPFLMGLRFAFQTEAKLYLVMDFYKGGELFFHLRKVKRFSEEQARLYIAEVSLALGHLHRLEFIYRDLKPENILMDDTGHICLTDFGLAKQLDPQTDKAHSFVGTPEYLAPEMVKGSGHGKAVDWWCVGILLYELTVGITPFYSSNVDEMYHKVVHSKIRFPPRLSEECKNLITSLLKKRPEERLGYSEFDIEEIKKHAFFDGFDWDACMRREIESTYKPRLNKEEDSTQCFSDQFLKQPVKDSVVPDSHLRQMPAGAEQEFLSWTFQADNPLHE